MSWVPPTLTALCRDEVLAVNIVATALLYNVLQHAELSNAYSGGSAGHVQPTRTEPSAGMQLHRVLHSFTCRGSTGYYTLLLLMSCVSPCTVCTLHRTLSSM